MNIAIVEDNTLQQKIIYNICLEYFTTNKLNYDIKLFSNAENFIFSYTDNKNFDLVILDIQMKEMTGIELAKKLRNNGDNCALIFITAINDYIFEGYSVNAIDYIIKPVDKNKLFIAINRSRDYLKKSDKFLLVQKDGVTKKINENNIYVIESSGRNIIINLHDTSYTLNKSISKFELELNRDIFVKCHRSYIVNIKYINSISKKEILLDNNTSIPISRGNYEKVNNLFINYFRGLEY